MADDRPIFVLGMGKTTALRLPAAIITCCNHLEVVIPTIICRHSLQRAFIPIIICCCNLQGAFIPTIILPCKLQEGEYDDVARVLKTAVDTFGKIDIVVASGGMREPKAALFADIPKDDLVEFFRTRAFHRVYALHAALPYMKAAGYGKLICVTSDAGRMPTPSESLIGAAAASVIFLTRALAREYARFGVRVNTISTTLTSGTPVYDIFKRERAAGSEAILSKAFCKG